MFSSHRSSVLILSLIICSYLILSPAHAGERVSHEGPRDLPLGSKKHEYQTHASPSDGEIYLEGIEDLDHLSYLSLRNFNLTDEGLLQSIRISGFGSVLAPHKLHQIDETASVLLQSADKKTKLSLLLELLIAHLRNGRLKRMSLADIEATTSNLNLTEAYLELRKSRLHTLGLSESEPNGADSPKSALNNDEIRCIHLVTLYKFDLSERQRLQSQQQSRVEYENGQASNGSQFEDATSDLSEEQEDSLAQFDGFANEDPIENQNEQALVKIDLDESRLIRLCKLAIVCRSADELIGLISKPWKEQTSRNSSKDRLSHDRTQLERDSSLDLYGSSSSLDGSAEMIGSSNFQNLHEPRARPKSLRDSLSLSLAKLCPLILFPLHEDEGQCSLRRDDRPPMITVWGFATLFVTIVCFCSLIGLSITPLLGHSATESTTSSDLNEPLTTSGDDLSADAAAFKSDINRKKRAHKASLTLFEGLAVGSLVGSALFSLIPQAFELQERESNQSFLLKAFIIFSGIYLFFCSERIMRIILDTRQMRKKRKQSLHRSSTTAPVDGVIVEAQPQQQQPSCCTREHSDLCKTRSNQSHSASQEPSMRPVDEDKTNSRLRKPDKKPNRIQADFLMQSKPAIPAPMKSSATNAHRHLVDRDAQVQNDRTRDEQHPNSTTRQALEKKRSTRGPRVDRSSRSSKRQVGSETQAQNRQSHKHKSRRKLKESGPSQARQKQGDGESHKIKRRDETSSKKRHSKRAAMAESHMDEHYYNFSRMHLSSSASTRCSTSSFSSYTRNRLRETQSGLVARVKYNGNSQLNCSFSSSCCECASCNSCASFMHEYNHVSDDDNDQDWAVNERMGEFSGQVVEEHPDFFAEGYNHDTLMSSSVPQLRTTFQCDEKYHDRESIQELQDGTLSRLTHHSSDHYSQRCGEQDISTVAWMIVLGDGLHNFIDGISIGAAFSESILSGVSISVAVICEEFPHELGDFAVLVSAGMTVRQALGYNFLSACTCYVGMAVGIILGDVTDGASYISALAAGVFLYIALVDMMGELSAALEESSRDSIAKTLKLLLLQNIGIFIGISIIFVLSFIDF